jgi:hypothetical protein
MDTEMCHGAVLTYARRYTLFALVGIDDLDASDLATPMKPGPASRAEKSKGRAGDRPNGESKDLSTMSGFGEGSLGTRDRLLAEINELGSTDDAANWAHRSL